MRKITINIKEEDKDTRFDKLLIKYGFDGIIPSNSIIDKVRPGIGGTTAELDSPRHSIIIEPYVTVMEVKRKAYGKALCLVMDGESNDNIKEYLHDSSIYYKKIMTTPEGFQRLIRTLQSFDSHYRSNFFLLYDEADKLIEECLFRTALINPLDEFFSFKNKAFISATPIIPTDDRFDLNGFSIIRFQPEWDYRKDIKIITTNNIRTTLRNVITLYNDEKPVFIFTNCKQTITYMSRLEGVADHYKVFCAEKLNTDFFIQERVANVEHSVETQNYAKYNFFTSRFFSSVDMLYNGNEKPHIIMVTNIPTITHSLINPFTQAIQIQGRCRKGISSITHVTGLYLDREFKTEESIEEDIAFSINFIKRLKFCSIAFHQPTLQTVLKELIGKQFALALYDNDGTINPYFKSARINQLKVENYYTTASSLLNAYDRTGFFKVHHRDVQHMFSKQDILKLDTLKGRRRSIAIVEKLNEIDTGLKAGNSINEESLREFYRMIEKEEILFTLYCQHGHPFLEELQFHKTKMKKAYKELRFSQRTNDYSNMVDEITLNFKLNIRINSDEIKVALQIIYDRYNFADDFNKPKQACGTDILLYFDGKYYSGKKKHPIHGYKSYYRLTKPKFQLSSDLKVLEVLA